MKTRTSAFTPAKALKTLLVSACFAAAAVLPSQGGVLLDYYYSLIPGNAVSDLTGAANYPSTPDSNEILTYGIATLLNVGTDYGRLIRGYIEAPQTGSYTFWIASDDDSELWLSPNTDSAGKVLIAANVGAVGLGDYTETPAQTSAAIPLVAGQKYYFEVLHKQGAGADFVSVMWQLPDGSYEDPVSEKHLWPFPVDTSTLLAYSVTPLSEAPLIISSYGGAGVDTLSPSTPVTEGSPLDLTITADGTQPAYVQWTSNGVVIPGANLLSLHFSAVTLAQNGVVYRATLTNSLGQASAATTLSVTPNASAPTLVDALNLGNPAADIAVVFSEAVDFVTGTTIGNYFLNNGGSISSAHMGSLPNVVLLKTAGLTVGTAYTLTVNNVRSTAATPIPILANSTIAVDPGLTTWLKLDESGGLTVNDSSGNGLNGTLMNGAQPDYQGKILRAAKLNGADGYINLPSGYDGFAGTGLTFSIWVYPIEKPVFGWARFFDLSNGAGNDNILLSRTGTSDMITFEVYVGGASGGKVTTRAVLMTNRWQHVAATLDPAGNVVIYVNGVALAAGTTGVPTVITRTQNFLGHSPWIFDGYYGGKMDDARIYSRVLSPSAVAALAAGAGADDVDLTIPIVSVAATVPTTALKSTPPGVLTVARTGSTAAALTAQYSLGGTATNGVAYTALPNNVSISAGSASSQVLVRPNDYSFTQPQQTVVLTITNNPAYIVGDSDTATVTILNNDVTLPPAPMSVVANNLDGALPTTVDVWWNEPVTLPTATTLANYSLTAPGLTVTNATLLSSSSASPEYHLRVVLGVSGPVPTNTSLMISGVQDPVGNSGSYTVPVRVQLTPTNIVATTYHGAANDRPTAFRYITDGVVNNVNNGGTGFDTWNGNTTPSQFVGLIYGTLQEVLGIKIDLGQQFGDGGDWQTQPNVYILKNPVDPGSTAPETDTNDWVRVSAQLVSGSQFHTAVDGSPSLNTPIAFDLSSVPPSQRTGYGWAVGGVLGNGANHFLSVSELRGFGNAQTNFAFVFLQQPTNVSVVAGQRVKLTGLAESTLPIAYQWQKNSAPISGATSTAYGIPPATPADDGAQFVLVASTPLGDFSSQPATLTVLPRLTPPAVVAAALDPTNSVLDVWFDESVDVASATTLANYGLNDSGVSLVNANQDANGFRVTLTYSGTPSVPNLTIGVSNIVDLSGNTLAYQMVPVLPLVNSPARVMANQYQQGRAAAFTRSTDGLVTYDANVTTWTTYGGPQGLTDFVGVSYDQPQVFGVVKVDLGYQFGDGGDWGFQPRVFIQKTPADTDQTVPETDPADWVEVPARLVSGNLFDMAPDALADTVPPPNTPIAFDLSHLQLNQRVGYGWAVGGVPGNGPNAQFVSIAELRAFGQSTSSLVTGTGAPHILFDVAPLTQSVPAGAPLVYSMLADGAAPLHYRWFFNGAPLSDNGRVTGSQSSALQFVETVPNDSGNYQLVVSNALASVTSSLAHVTVTRVALNDGVGWQQNGGPAISSNVVTLTDGIGGEARSIFLRCPLYIGAFKASWTYQDIGGGGADGTVFVVQNDPRGPTALGGGGGGLGYSGITPSGGLEFDIYAGSTPGIALRSNGATGGPYWSTAPVSIPGGHPLDVKLQYNGTTLSLVITDTVASVSFSTNWPINLPAVVGGTNTAYVGFTSATGGVASQQQVSNFSFYNPPPITKVLTGPNSLVLSWPASSVGFRLQQATDLVAGNWTLVTNPVDLVNGNNQVTITPLTGTHYYRLILP